MYIILIIIIAHKQLSHSTGKFQEEIDSNLFKDPPYMLQSRGKRQSENLSHLAYPNEQNYTEEDMAICKNDLACVFDLVVTQNKEFATDTLKSGENFTDQAQKLCK